MRPRRSQAGAAPVADQRPTSTTRASFGPELHVGTDGFAVSLTLGADDDAPGPGYAGRARLGGQVQDHVQLTARAADAPECEHSTRRRAERLEVAEPQDRVLAPEAKQVAGQREERSRILGLPGDVDFGEIGCDGQPGLDAGRGEAGVR